MPGPQDRPLPGMTRYYLPQDYVPPTPLWRKAVDLVGLGEAADQVAQAVGIVRSWLPEPSPEQQGRQDKWRAYEQEQDARRQANWETVKSGVSDVWNSEPAQALRDQLYYQYAPLWTPRPEIREWAEQAKADNAARFAPLHEALSSSPATKPLDWALTAREEMLPNFVLDSAVDATTPLGLASNVVDVGPMVKAGLPLVAKLGALKSVLGGGASIAGMLPPGETLSTINRARRTLGRTWPGVEAALTKHGADITLPGAKRSYATALDRLVADIHASTLADGGSSTYPLSGAREVAGQSEGFTVGRYSNQSGKTKAIPISQFSPDDIRAFIEEHADEFARPATGKVSPSLLGTWHDKDSGLVYLDVSQKHPTARSATVAGAIQKQPPETVRDPVTGLWPKAQEAIFDLQKIETPPIGNLAEFVGSPEFRQRLDEMYEAGVPVMEGKNWWDLRGTALEKVYGKKRLKGVAGYLASTSSGAPPVHNLRAASEYIRRWIKGEPIIQPEFRIPETSVGWREGSLGGQVPGDFNSPGTMMPFEKTRAPNLMRVYEGTPEQIRKDKMNDMFHALLGEKRAVIDRRYAKLAEDPSRGIYVSGTKDKVPGGMGTTQVSPYALIENAVRSAAEARGMDLDHYSAYVWEGIGNTIKQTGELYGVKHPAHTIPEASQGFAGIFERMIEEKAGHWGITVDEFKRRLKAGDAELLMALLSTSAGAAVYSQWAQEDQMRSSGSPPPPPWQSRGGA